MITVNELTIAIQNCITKAKAALTEKGVAVSDSDTLSTLADKIRQVPIYEKQPTQCDAVVTILTHYDELANTEIKGHVISATASIEVDPTE